MNYVIRLLEQVRAVCPGAEVRVGRRAVRDTWELVPAVGNTQPQIDAGNAVIDGFVDTPEAQAEWEADRNPERKTLRQQAAAAVQGNLDFLAIASPNAAQVRDQVRALTQQNNRIIQRLVQVD